MPTDHLLNTVLELFQTVHDSPTTDQITGSTVSLLANLTNPLNLGVLTSQLLVAPAIWHRRDGLNTAFRVINIFNSAAIRVRQRDYGQTGPSAARRPSCDEWAKAVIKGCDEFSTRWQHLLVLAGLLMGLGQHDEHNGPRSLSRGLRITLEQAIVTAVNLALSGPMRDGPVASASIVVALSFAMPLLSDVHRNSINGNALLPMTMQTITGPEGFNGGDFIAEVGAEFRSQQGQQVEWRPASGSFQRLRELESRPLMRGMGACVKVATHAIQCAQDHKAVLRAQDELLGFTQRILEAWRSTVLSAMEPTEEQHRLSEETLRDTWPAFWDMLKKTMYAAVALLQAVMARCILDGRLGSDGVAPSVATKALYILRNLYFISSRDGNSNFQIYSFAYLTSIDILSRYPAAAHSLLLDLRPTTSGPVPMHALHRTLDLFYLNLAEHLPLSLNADICDAAIVQPAINYLSQALPDSPLLRELFEAAHCAILAVLSCPHNSPLAVKLVPFYVDTLLSSFPEHISPRQFRVAFKTVMQIVSPPFPVSATNPELSEVLLEMVEFRAASVARPERLPPAPEALDQPPCSEQSTLVLAVVDALPFLPLPLVEEWLDTTAGLMLHVKDSDLRLPAWRRFWEVLESGEMDVERSFLAVAWWHSRGGRDRVFAAQGSFPIQPVMSGAIAPSDQDGDARSSRL
jgi:hypothetical protein